MSDRFDGRYFDGQSDRPRAVELRRVGGAHFALEGDGVRRNGTLASLAVTPRLARVARAVEFADGARLILAHDAAIDGWFPRRGRIEAVVDRLERHAYAVTAAMLVCAATLVAGARWGVPWLADRIAEEVPAAVERSLGAEVMKSLDKVGLNASALDADLRNRLAARFAALARDAGGDYRLEFRNAPRIGANAFAVPGGTVVVTDQLVRLLDDDREFDAVVAHEIGHQQRRHALRQTLRGSLVAIVAALFAGDVSSAGAVVVAVPTFLLDSHYSRGFEAEADRYAFDLLARREESPHWFAAAMRRLQSEVPDDGHLAYLSSHPATQARIDEADAAARAFAASHPDLCPNGVCPGENEDASGCDDCDDDDARRADDIGTASLACGKNSGG
jgi:Zn-dependent protease with chaperone function